jgi:hypothetical protein
MKGTLSMKHTKLALGSIVVALLAGACTDMEMDAPEDGEADDVEDTSTIEQGSWSAWYNLSGPYHSGYVRACKTSTRINWEFGYNSYPLATTVVLPGGGAITSNIAGQSWGQKYRTRGSATLFAIYLGTPEAPRSNGISWEIWTLPNC